MTTRLRLICNAATAATRRSAFAGDEPIDAAALRKLAALPPLTPQRCLSSPALRARQTADALQWVPTVDPALRDCDYGRWTGRTLEAVLAAEPDALASWMADPTAAPHGGESVAAVIARVGAWLGAQAAHPGPVTAITHAAIIRAAIIHVLGAPATAFAAIDVAPLTAATFSAHGGRWTFSGMAPLGQ